MEQTSSEGIGSARPVECVGAGERNAFIAETRPRHLSQQCHHAGAGAQERQEAPPAASSLIKTTRCRIFSTASSMAAGRAAASGAQPRLRRDCGQARLHSHQQHVVEQATDPGAVGRQQPDEVHRESYSALMKIPTWRSSRLKPTRTCLRPSSATPTACKSAIGCWPSAVPSDCKLRSPRESSARKIARASAARTPVQRFLPDRRGD